MLPLQSPHGVWMVRNHANCVSAPGCFSMGRGRHGEGRASRQARRGRQYNGVNPEGKDGFVRFSELVQYFLKLEGTSGRIALVEILAELFMRTPTEDVPPTAYLLQGRLAPYFEPVEIGLCNNYVADAIARAFGRDRATVLERFDRLGDLGEAAAEIATESGSSPVPTKVPPVREIFDRLLEIAHDGCRQRQGQGRGVRLAARGARSAVVQLPVPRTPGSNAPGRGRPDCARCVLLRQSRRQEPQEGARARV